MLANAVTITPTFNATTVRFQAVWVRLGRLVHRLGVVQLYNVLYTLEILLTLTGMFLLIMALRYRMRSNVHANIKRIFANADLHFIVFSPVRFVNIALVLTWYNEGKPLDILTLQTVGIVAKDAPDMALRTYYVAYNIRVYFMVVVALTLPAAALERVFATIFVRDYERAKRSCISTVLIITVNLFSLVLTWLMTHPGLLTTVSMVTLASSNICGLALFIWCSKKNTDYYYTRITAKPRSVGRAYSLSERFQITENIRVAKLLRNMYIIVWVTQAALIGLCTIPVVVENDVVDLITWQVFNIALAVFMNVLAFVNLYPSQQFRDDRARLRKAFARIGQSAVRDVPQNGVPLRGVFGTQLVHSTEEQAAVYFAQLEQLWAAPANNQKRN